MSASFLKKINEPFCLENASIFIQEFFYDNFSRKSLLMFLLILSYKIFFDILNKKSLLNFLIKITIKKLMCQVLCHFSEKWMR